MRVPTNSSIDPELPMLTEKDLTTNPLELFHRWFQDAQKSSQIRDPNAMCLSTISPTGEPEGRIVLLREIEGSGFIFYTNSQSTKGLALGANPRAALTFYWEALSRQVRAAGAVSQISPEQADKYFHSRPRSSQIGAWASAQSNPLDSRSTLELRVKEITDRYDGQQVPRPQHWNGYRVEIDQIEFWQERRDRLHDRFKYANSTKGWSWTRLNP